MDHFCFFSRSTVMGVAPTAVASATLSCLSSSLLSVKIRGHTRLLALRCNPRLAFCGDHPLPQPLHKNGTKIGMGSDRSCEPQLHLSMASLVVVWLSHLQTPPSYLRCPPRPCRRGHGCSQDCLLDPPVLRAGAKPPERVASHDFHQPLCVSDRSVVSGFHIGSFLRTDILNCFVQHFVGSVRWLSRQRQVPTTRCRREILPCSRINTETLSLRS